MTPSEAFICGLIVANLLQWIWPNTSRNFPLVSMAVNVAFLILLKVVQ